jgi:1-deoxy-D-xylulose-5-phosphate synthase
VRYPKCGEGRYTGGGVTAAEVLRAGADFTLVTYGTLVNTALGAADELALSGISVELVKLGRISPMDYDLIETSVSKTRRLLVLEDCVAAGCVGERILARLSERGILPETAILKNVGARHIPCGSLAELQKLCGLDAESVARAVWEALREKDAS